MKFLLHGHRRWLLLIASLLILSILYLLQRHLFQGAVQQTISSQQLLAAQTAARLEDTLYRVTDDLQRIADMAADSSMDPLTLRRQLTRLYGTYADAGLDAVCLLDANGNLFAAHPSGAVIARGFPIHLLESAGQTPSGPGIIPLAEGRLLRLYQPIKAHGRPALHLIALLSLERMTAFCLRPLGQEADLCFLLSDDGRFQLHRNPAMVGLAFSEVISFRQYPDYYHFVATLTRGDFNSRNYVLLPAGLVYPPSAAAETRKRTMLLTGAPVRVKNSLWALVLALPEFSPTALHGPGTLFLLLPWFLLLALLLVPVARRLRHPPFPEAEPAERMAETVRWRQTAEQAERRYRHLLDHAGDAIFFIDPVTGLLQEVNRQAETLFGYRAEEVRTLSLNVLFPGQNRRRYLRLVRKVLRDGYGEEGNLLFRRKDGQTFIGAVHARLGELGERQVVHGVLRDVSQLKRMEQELRQKNQDLLLMNEIADRVAGSRTLGEILPPVLERVIRALAADGGGIYLVAPEDRSLRLAARQGIEEPLRREIETLPPGEGLCGRVAISGQPKMSIDCTRDNRKCSEAVRRAGWGGFQAVPLTAKDRTVGVLFIFNLSKRVLTTAESKLLAAIGKQLGTAVEGGQLLDALQKQVRLTRRANNELKDSRRQLRENLAAMEEANRSLARLDRMKSNFLALASHELRTPLTYVLSGAELMTVQLLDRLTEEEGRILQAVHQGGKRLQAIVEDLLEMARLESQSLYLARERVELPGLLEKLAGEFEPVLAERGLALRLSPPLPTLHLTGDAYHLQRTFHRLLENAIKFTPEEGVIEIRIEAQTAAAIWRQESLLRPFSPTFFAAPTPERLVRISICDSGVGIAPEDHVRIFDKFYGIGEIAEHSTSRTRFGGKGVGLGLTLVKGMIEAHGGMVWVENAGLGGKGAGTTFHVLLPLPVAGDLEEIHYGTG